MTHVVVALKNSDDVIQIVVGNFIEVANDEEQRRPDVQGVPRCIGCTKESQIEVTW